jgi:hypothetical protein
MVLQEVIEKVLRKEELTEMEIVESLKLLIRELYYIEDEKRNKGEEINLEGLEEGDGYRIELFREDDSVDSCDCLIKIVNTLEDDEINKTLK